VSKSPEISDQIARRKDGSTEQPGLSADCAMVSSLGEQAFGVGLITLCIVKECKICMQ
jgi:hypothetical protein